MSSLQTRSPTSRGQSLECVLAYCFQEPVAHLPPGFALYHDKRFIRQLAHNTEYHQAIWRVGGGHDLRCLQRPPTSKYREPVE